MTMPKPNLFLVGFQKCGSSAFYRMLCEHPDISGTEPKETFYLTDESYENYKWERNVSNPKADWSFFLRQDVQTPYILEASVCNFYQKTAQEYIGSQNRAKVLFILRDPVERFISNYKYYSANIPKFPSNLSIEEYFNRVRNSDFENDSLKFAIEHGCYSKYVKNWKSIVGEDRVHIVSFRELVNNPSNVMFDICDFLGITYMPPGKLKRMNQSRQIKNRRIHKLLIKYFSGDFLLKNKLKKIYYFIFSVKREMVIRDSLKRKLKEEYAQEYKEFQDYF